MAEKYYAGIMVVRTRGVTEGVNGVEEGDFRLGSGYVDQIFT